ncbi:glycosyltransferase family 4 protein [Methanobrevibacter sp.]
MEITLISRYFDTRIGGAGSHNKLIYEGLQKHDLKLNRISQEDCLINSYSKFAYLYFSALDLKRILAKREYKNTDVYHAMTPLESFYIPKNKSVASVLDFIPLNEADSFISSAFAKFFERSIRSTIKCEQVITNNSDIRTTLNQKYGTDLDKITVVPPPIDGRYHPAKKENDVYTIGTISNLMKRKRVHLLIESFLKADIENSQLLIGGNGAEKENLQKLASNDSRIKFLGFVDDGHMNDFYNSLDVFVFPTAEEGYGMPMVEAMACGKPVITLSDAIIPTDVKEKTTIVTKENLANALENREFDCDIKKNIEFYKQHSTENISKRLLKVYKRI